MKKYAPYLLALIVFLIFAVLIYRWYLSTRPTPQITPEGVSIQNLTEEEASDLLKGTDDYQEVKLEAGKLAQAGLALGTVRYLFSGDKLNFSVVAQLPAETKGNAQTHYYVWVRLLNSNQWHLAGQLKEAKGGLLASAALPKDVLPVEVIVSTTDDKNQAADQVVLKGVIPTPEEKK